MHPLSFWNGGCIVDGLEERAISDSFESEIERKEQDNAKSNELPRRHLGYSGLTKSAPQPSSGLFRITADAGQ